MQYRVHRIAVNSDIMQAKPKQFFNTLEEKVISIIPDITRYFWCYGAKTDYVLIIEKSLPSR